MYLNLGTIRVTFVLDKQIEILVDCTMNKGKVKDKEHFVKMTQVV